MRTSIAPAHIINEIFKNNVEQNEIKYKQHAVSILLEAMMFE